MLTDAALLSHITEAETYRRHIGACKHTHINKQKVLHKTVKPTKPDCICKEIQLQKAEHNQQHHSDSLY